MAPHSALTRRVVADARTRTISFALLLFAIVWANGVGYTSTYPKLADRLKLVATFGDNKAARMLYGYGHNLASVGGYVAWRAGGLAVLFAGMFGIFAAARAMRADEDAGRTELVLAGAFTRRRAFAATITGISITLVPLWIAVALAGILAGLAVPASLYFGLTVAIVAAVYAGIGAVANQLFASRRSALGFSAAVLAVDFLVRVVADTTDHVGVHWFHPLGWAEELRAYTGTHAWVMVLPIALTAVSLVVAAVLHDHRDLGGSYVAPHDSAAARTRLLTSPTAFAFRAERVMLASWTLGVVVFALIVGSIAKTVEKIELPEPMREQLAKLGGIDITKARGYVGLTFVIFVFIIALFVCSQLSAARDEEANHRLETLFALPYGRNRWLGGRIVLALVATAVCALAAGAAAGIGTLATGGHMTFLEGLEAGVNVLPVEVLFLGLGVLFLAFVPRFGIGLLYGVIAAAFVWELFGALLSFPNWLLDVSPFHHVAPVPAKSIAVVSALVLVAVGVLAGAGGMARFRARDLTGD